MTPDFDVEAARKVAAGLPKLPIYQPVDLYGRTELRSVNDVPAAWILYACEEIERLRALLDVRTQSWMNTTDALSEADDRYKIVLRERDTIAEALRACTKDCDYGDRARQALKAAGLDPS